MTTPCPVGVNAVFPLSWRLGLLWPPGLHSVAEIKLRNHHLYLHYEQDLRFPILMTVHQSWLHLKVDTQLVGGLFTTYTQPASQIT